MPPPRTDHVDDFARHTPSRRFRSATAHSHPAATSAIRAVLPVALAAVLASPLAAAETGYPLGGAKQPQPQLALKRNVQYKRVHQLTLRLLLLDRVDEARAILDRHIEANPDDAESFYMRGVMLARANDVEAAASAFQKSIDLGLPRGRLIAGPRSLLQPFSGHESYRRLSDEFSTRPVHGPLVGQVTDRGAAFWVRTATEADVVVVTSASSDFAGAVRHAAVRTRSNRDYTGVARAGGLKPDTEYHYGIQIGDGPVRRDPHQKFRTFPGADEPARFCLAFGGGAGYVPAHERMWDTIRGFRPLALLLLGDNVYIDDPESPIMQQYTYHRRQSRPEWRRLTAATATFTIWDDHDFSTNDSWGGSNVDIPFWKLKYSWPIFVENWANPPYASGPDRPGCWYAFSIADVDFVLLDCRYYRTSPQDAAPDMLGPVQLAWLKKRLLDSNGTFKVLCSSVPWDFRTKGDSVDTWNGYRAQREEIFAFIEEHGIEGVVLMSADRHRSDAWRIERPNGYDFYEFNSSRLTNEHMHSRMEEQGALFSYNAKQSFGLVSFDTAAADPSVQYEVVTIDGERVHALEVRRSQLNVR